RLPPSRAAPFAAVHDTLGEEADDFGPVFRLRSGTWRQAPDAGSRRDASRDEAPRDARGPAGARPPERRRAGGAPRGRPPHGPPVARQGGGTWAPPWNRKAGGAEAPGCARATSPRR